MTKAKKKKSIEQIDNKTSVNVLQENLLQEQNKVKQLKVNYNQEIDNLKEEYESKINQLQEDNLVLSKRVLDLEKKDNEITNSNSNQNQIIIDLRQENKNLKEELENQKNQITEMTTYNSTEKEDIITNLNLRISQLEKTLNCIIKYREVINNINNIYNESFNMILDEVNKK